MENCIFCKIVKGEEPCHKIWEDEKHLGFLSNRPNTEGFTIVITKKHYPSYIFDLPDKIIKNLIIASKKVAKLLDRKLENVIRTGLIFEGLEVNHIHAKLSPVHGVKQKNWKPILSDVDKYFNSYEGYISFHDYKLEDNEKLAKLAEKIRK